MDLTFLKKGPRNEQGIGLFSMVRDELYFLPRFFQHYRALGVTDFVIYDDRSADGTTEYLVAQPDCTVVTGPYRFDTTFGVMPTGLPKKFFDYVKEILPDTFFNNRWALTVDADEFVFLPSKCGDLGAFTSFLEAEKRLYASGPMVDLFPQRLADMLESSSEDFFALMPYHDHGPLYQRISRFPYVRKEFAASGHLDADAACQAARHICGREAAGFAAVQSSASEARQGDQENRVSLHRR